MTFCLLKICEFMSKRASRHLQARSAVRLRDGGGWMLAAGRERRGGRSSIHPSAPGWDLRLPTARLGTAGVCFWSDRQALVCNSLKIKLTKIGYLVWCYGFFKMYQFLTCVWYASGNSTLKWK